jgi:hypothetical protein
VTRDSDTSTSSTTTEILHARRTVADDLGRSPGNAPVTDIREAYVYVGVIDH